MLALYFRSIFPLFFLLYRQNFNLTHRKAEREEIREIFASETAMERVCFCRNRVYVCTSWTNLNPGKRFHPCHICGYFNWVDPTMCEQTYYTWTFSNDQRNRGRIEQIKQEKCLFALFYFAHGC